ncbi:MAG: type II toxin-antitoxin system HicB family antitoxin [Dehalococcoidia bacterium]
MRRYTAVLSPDTEDGGYTVTVPALPGCITEGDSLEEALDNARDAIRLYLDDLAASGEELPVETAPPELAQVEV